MGEGYNFGDIGHTNPRFTSLNNNVFGSNNGAVFGATLHAFTKRSLDMQFR